MLEKRWVTFCASKGRERTQYQDLTGKYHAMCHYTYNLPLYTSVAKTTTIMKLEINLKNIEQIAKLKEDENISFRSYLKVQDSEKVDEIVHRLYEEIAPQIDCLNCGNCCLNLRPIATDKVLSLFVEPKDIEAFKYLKSFPCKNLCDKKCTVYSVRPEECRSYPYLHKDEFVTRTYGALQNYEICPIVFNVFELLKKELMWINK
jgi:hypothetical protein